MKKELNCIFLFWLIIGLLGGTIVCKTPTPIIVRAKSDYHIVDYTIQNTRNYVQQVKVVLIKLERNFKNRNVYVYYDPDYELFEIDRPKVLAIINFLKNELKIEKYPNPIKIINADDLKNFLLDKNSPENAILIIPTGAFPNNVYSIYHNLVKPWIEKGGILIWTTSYFGYYSALKNKNLPSKDSFLNPQKRGEIDFWGTRIISYQLKHETGTFKSKIGTILSLQYPFLYRGINIKKVKLLKGKILGYIRNYITSIGFIPLGRGKIIIFGGFIPKITYSHIIAKDISRIVSSGILSGDIKDFKEYTLLPCQSLNDQFIINSKDRYVLYIFQDSEEGSFYKRIYIERR